MAMPENILWPVIEQEFKGIGVVMQINLSPMTLATPVSALPLWINLPADALGKTAQGGLNAWFPATYVGDTDGIPSSWLLPCPTLATVAS